MPWRLSQDLTHASCYGIGHDDPDITPAQKCRYDACVEVPANFVAKNPVSIGHLPGGRYAVASYQGDGTDIGITWRYLFRDWLPASGYQIDSKPCCEHYTEKSVLDPVTGIFDCALCLPVKPL